jgi:hypothetical protein
MKKYFFLIIIVLMLASCTPTVQQEATPTFRFGVPVESEAHALIAAHSGLIQSYEYTEPLKVVKVEQMSFEEYGKFTGASNNRPTDTRVWMIIYFDDQWQSKAPIPGVTPYPQFHGCVSVAINAADGLPLEVGGLRSGTIPECDQ